MSHRVKSGIKGYTNETQGSPTQRGLEQSGDGTYTRGSDSITHELTFKA